jgi:hypothetical protein
MRRLLSALCLAALVTVASPSVLLAQQSVSVYLGGFVPSGLSGRSDTDVLVNNILNGDYSLDIETSDFAGFTIGAEWLVGITRNIEAGLGVGYYANTVESVYAFLVEDNGTEIAQDLRLRIVPFSATLRFLPFGRDRAVLPYIGAGVGVLAWNYSEVGEFVDTFDDSVFQGRFIDSGAAVGPLVVGGVRFSLGSFDVGGEIRYQNATGDLDDPGFTGTTIDLGGFSYLGTFNVKF